MRNFAVLVVAGVALAGCNTALDPTVATPNQVLVAVNAFDAAEVAATNYLRLPLCATNGPTICRNAVASKSIANGIRAGRPARDQLTTALANNASAPLTVYQTLTAAVSSLEVLTAQK